MLKSDDITPIIYDFLQELSRTELQGFDKMQKVPAEYENRVFTLLNNLEYLSAVEIADFALEEKQCIHALLMQYVMFLTMTRELPFPDDFLHGSDKNKLGKTILRYMAEHRWPFPQMFHEGKAP